MKNKKNKIISHTKTDTLKIHKDTIITTIDNKANVTVQYVENKKTETFLNIDKDIWFSIIVPVSLFVLGLLLSFIIKKINSYFSNRKLKNFIVDWVNLIKEPLERQEKAFRDFSIEVDSIDSFPNGLVMHNLHSNKLKSINPVDLKSLIIDNLHGEHEKKAKLLYKLSSQIDYLERIEQNAVEYLNTHKIITKELVDEWNENISAFNAELNTHFAANASNIGTDPLLKQIYPIQDAWKKHVDVTKQTYIRDHLISPLIDMCHKYLEETSFKDTRAFTFLKACEEVRTTIKKNMVHVDSASKRFKLYERDIRICKKGLVISKTRLDKMCLKLYCK